MSAGAGNNLLSPHPGGCEFKIFRSQTTLNAFGICEKANNSACRKQLRQQPEPFSREFAAHQVNACDVGTGLIKTTNHSFAYGVASDKRNWNRPRNRLCRAC